MKTGEQSPQNGVESNSSPASSEDAAGEVDSPGGSIVWGSGSVQMQRSQRLYQHFLTDAAAGLTFSHDSAVDLGAGGVSYSQADFCHLFRPTGALKPSANRHKTQERKLCRPAQRPKGRQAPPERFRDLLALLESLESADSSPVRLQTVELLQGSCRATAASSAGQHLKRASGLAKPVHKAAHRDHIILDNSSKYHKNLQRWSSPAPQRWTGPDKMAAHPNQKSITTGSPKRDQTHLADQVQPAVTTSCTPTGPRPRSDSAGPDPDSWVAAHCLALDGDHSRRVIQRLLAQLFLGQDYQPDRQDRPPSSQDRPPDTQLVVSLLTSLSSRTTLVRSLLAEQLNSSEWSNRLSACNALSGLKGPIHKDVVHKLTHLMWSEQCCTVRLAAAEALMKLGKMQHVHSELRLKLEEGRGLQGRMEALDIMVQLKLMTATLLEPLVSCLSDESTAVRKQACQTAACLLLNEEAVVSRLLELLENDPAREVRLSAIRAVGVLALSSSDVQEALQRCVETEEEAELRLAACQLLQSAGVTSAQLQDFLLQRLNVESSRRVRRTMKEVLHRCDRGLQEERRTATSINLQEERRTTTSINLQEERRTTTSINLQVKRLCEWRVITEKVLLLEKLQAGGSPGQSKSPVMLAKLLTQQYRTDQY